MIYTLPDLPYKNDALAPSISKETVDYHYGKHERAYIDNLNRLIKDTQYEDMELEEIITSSSGPLFNNASQAWNHIFYFFSFSPDGSHEPDGHLRKAIDEQFGSFEQFKKEFEDAGSSIFGSGWVWLSKDKDGKLFITQTSKRRQPSLRGSDTAVGFRCVGTCLLYRLPQPPTRCSQGALEDCRLGYCSQPLHLTHTSTKYRTKCKENQFIVKTNIALNKHNVMNGERGSRETPSLFVYYTEQSAFKIVTYIENSLIFEDIRLS